MNKAQNISVFLILCIATVCFSCQGSRDPGMKSSTPGSGDMEDLNRYFVQKDREIIQNYIERKKLKMTGLPSGLWYAVLREGDGELFRENDRIVIEYECSLLDGTICYSSEKEGPKVIILGRSEIETGLNEGLKLLSSGAEAIFILPPFLAHGLLGDRKKIPPRSTIVYNIKVLDGNITE